MPSFSEPTVPAALQDLDDLQARPQIAIARQAIVDEERAVFAYELFDRSVAGQAFTAASDAALLFNALSLASSDALAGNTRLLFINCTHDSLSGGHLELVNPDKVVLEVPTLPGNQPELIESQAHVLHQLRERGFRIAFDQSVLRKLYTAWLPLASFIKLDMTAFDPEVTEQLVRAVRGHTTAQIVAEKVETEAQYQRMAALGVKLFQGYWFARPAELQAHAMRPSQATIIQLLNLLRKQASPQDVEELLKKDPTLSFNLLHFINAAGLANEGEVTNFSQAVARLGMQKLFRWAALLMTTSRGSAAPPAVGCTAVVRGRLMELLAADLDMAAEAENAFIAGVFSLLDVMLEQPPAQALESVVLPATVRDALRDNAGPLAPLLAVAKACESGDDEQFAQAANALGLTNHQVNWAHVQALAWADSLE